LDALVTDFLHATRQVAQNIERAKLPKLSLCDAIAHVTQSLLAVQTKMRKQLQLGVARDDLTVFEGRVGFFLRVDFLRSLFFDTRRSG
jgi:hypothetical protein